MPKVSAEHKEQVRQRLMQAARDVVLRDGHEGATTRAILSEAGLSAGALYTYFDSKEALFEATAEADVAKGLAQYAMSALPGEDSADLLIRFATMVLTEPETDHSLTYFRGRMNTDPDLTAALAAFNRYLVEALGPIAAKAQADQRVPDDVDVEALIELFDILIDGLNRRAAMDTFATDFDRVGALAVRLLTNALLGRQPVATSTSGSHR